MEAAKFVYAAVFAALTAAASIFVDQPWLTIALAAVTAVGVYFVPNKPVATPTNEDRPL